jgi:ABC-type uncharacterized transport system involved in gliding motility auxiliary subunit
MRKRLSSKMQLRATNAVFVLLLLTAVGLLQWLSLEYDMRFDWTRNSRNSLSEASVTAIGRLQGPVKITAFATQRKQLREAIRELLGRYQRHKPDIELEFVDPDREPERARQAGVRFDGQVVLSYGEAREVLTRLDEQTITNALVRLGRRGERWLVFLAGHGERSPERRANFDLSNWAAQLRKRGFQTHELNLAEQPQIPRNTAALIIAGPRADLLAGEVEAIRRYLEGGGNLLWLADPGPLYGLQPIAEMLGIEFEPGVIVDPGSKTLTGNATAIVVTRYSKHPAVRDFRNVTLFPNAVGIRLDPPQDWKGVVLFDTRNSAWSETGVLSGTTRMDKGEDIAGPLNLAVVLTRARDDGEQRVVVVGDGDFLSNTFLGNGMNLELGMSIANWVSQDDAYVNIPVRVNADRTIMLTQTSRLLIGAGFLFVLPLLFAASGTFVWLRRRKL